MNCGLGYMINSMMMIATREHFLIERLLSVNVCYGKIDNDW